MAESAKKLQPHLADLNPEQLEAVTYGEGPLLVFAGAGSGKTRVLTRRIAHLILEYNVHPAQIFAVTFTNKAAREMKERVSQLFRGKVIPSWVSTFHAACARILRQHGEYLKYTPQFVIYDDGDTLATLKRVYKRLNIDPRIIEPRVMRTLIDRAKNNYHFPDDVRNDRRYPEHISHLHADIYDAYQKELHASNAMDFGDLICNVVTLFKLEPKILSCYTEQFHHLLIDEYQDTNRVQYLLLKLLTQDRHNICVVGDDDQSIYAFRGATIENILNFRKDFPEAKMVTLRLNYRSSKNILQAANAVIARNKRRQKKTISTNNPVGRLIVCYRGEDENEEAEFIAREMIALVRGGMRPAEMAVFYRVNALSRAVEEALVSNGIPYEIYGGFRFYERKEIKDILAYYRLLLNPVDNEAFLRVINTPARGLGGVSIGSLVAYAQEKKLPLLPALQQALAEKASWLGNSNIKKFKSFVDLIDDLLLDAKSAVAALIADNSDENAISMKMSAISDLLEAIARKSLYLKRLEEDGSPEATSKIENILELMTVASEFSRRIIEEGQVISLGDFLDRASLASDTDRENIKSAAGEEKPLFCEPVSLMTLHLAKGLEFGAVFFCGLEEGLLPHVRSLDSSEDLEEERRLCYVGITRAKKLLYFTRALERGSYNRSSYYPNTLSRFINDIPRSILDDTTNSFLGY